MSKSTKPGRPITLDSLRRTAAMEKAYKEFVKRNGEYGALTAVAKRFKDSVQNVRRRIGLAQKHARMLQSRTTKKAA